MLLSADNLGSLNRIGEDTAKNCFSPSQTWFCCACSSGGMVD